MATTQPDATGVGAEDLRRLLDGRYADLRRQILDVLGQPEFAPPLAIPTAEYRERGLDEGFDPFEVFRAVQNHAVAAARAHIERVVLEAFARAVDACEDGPVKDALGRLCDEVRGDGGALVDAFGIPDPVLRAPIGLRGPA